MAEIKHTAGPWRADIYGDTIRVLQDGPLPAVIVCDLMAWTGPARVEAEANARLIAAAPDLLAALRALLDACEMEANRLGGDFGPMVGPAAETAYAALSKATDMTVVEGG